MVYRLVIKRDREGKIILTSQQQHYLKRVLRMGEGDRFIAMDGQGQSWLAQIRGNSAQIIEQLNLATELPVAVTLMVALPKGNAFDEVVRCCTELGVATLLPVISDRTLLKPSPRKLERWRRIATEAAEQSERQIVCKIIEPLHFNAALTAVGNLETETDYYICVARGDADHLLTCLQRQPRKSIVVAIGPEGGWTSQEIEAAIATGFQPVSLGRRILRAVTAPVVALSLIAAVVEK